MIPAERDDHTACQAAHEALYEAAVEIMENPPSLGTQRELFDHRLGTMGLLYHRDGWEECLRERDVAWAEVERLREENAELRARLERVFDNRTTGGSHGPKPLPIGEDGESVRRIPSSDPRNHDFRRPYW